MATKRIHKTGRVRMVAVGDEGEPGGPATCRPEWVASSPTGAVRVAREAGYRVVRKGGLLEWGHCPDCETNHWTVTVQYEPEMRHWS